MSFQDKALKILAWDGTYMIAEELKEAEKLYPARWIEEALKEAVMLNKRSWKREKQAW